MVYFQRSSAQE